MADDDRQLTRAGRDRKAELLRHAEQLFTERGFANTRMVDIAEAAGVAKGLVYWYFESKDALLADIVLDVRDRLRVAQAEAVEGVDHPLERIYRGVRRSVVFVAENWQLYSLLQSASPTEDSMRETSRAHASDTVRQIERGQELGIIRADEAAVPLAYGIQGLVNNLAISFLRGEIRPLEDAAETAARFAIRGIASSESVACEVIDRVSAAPAR